MDILDPKKDRQVGPRARSKPKTLLEAKMKKTESFLLWAHHEKKEFFGKDSHVGKSKRQQEKRKPKEEMN